MLFQFLLAMLVQTFLPASDRIASDFEVRLHAGAETAQLIGAAGHVARYTPLAARAL